MEEPGGLQQGRKESDTTEQLHSLHSVYSCYLFLISSASVRPILFLSFIVPIFEWNIPLVSLIFLKRSLVFPILLFSSIFFALITEEGFLISPCYSLELCIQIGISFLSFSPLPFSSLLFTAICKASSENHFAFLHFFLLTMGMITSCFGLLFSFMLLILLLAWGSLSFCLFHRKFDQELWM